MARAAALGRAVTAVAVLLAFALPATVRAATVTGDGEAVSIHYAAAPGEQNTVSARNTEGGSSNITVSDTTAFLVAAGDCVQVNRRTVSCPENGYFFTADLGDGNDTLVEAPFYGSTEVHGGPGNDRLSANSNDTSAYGDAGDDTIAVNGNGAASADGGPGNDRITNLVDEGYLFATGGPGNDVLSASAGGRLAGGPGNDVIGIKLPASESRGSSLDLLGEDGIDRLTGGPDVDRLDGGAGPDMLNGGDEEDFLDGGPGDDVLDGGTGPDEMRGGTGTDQVTYATRGAGVIASIGGAAEGEAGERDSIATDVERLTGGAGDDTLGGAGGADRLEGLGGADRLIGLDGGDLLLGGDGDDLFDGVSATPDGADIVQGGAGEDTISYAARGAGVTVTPGTGYRDDGGYHERDTVAGDVENVVGTRFADTLVGSSAVNVLRAGAGADTVRTAGDGVADVADCGDEGGPSPQTVIDRVEADASDQVVGCEERIRPSV